MDSKARKSSKIAAVVLAAAATLVPTSSEVFAKNTGYVPVGHGCSIKVSGFSHWGNPAASTRRNALACRTITARVYWSNNGSWQSETRSKNENYVRAAGPYDDRWEWAYGKSDLSGWVTLAN